MKGFSVNFFFGLISSCMWEAFFGCSTCPRSQLSWVAMELAVFGEINEFVGSL